MNINLELPTPKQHSVNQMVACGIEIAEYLGDHSNWPDPIIAVPDLCQEIVWVPANFDNIENRWMCIDD